MARRGRKPSPLVDEAVRLVLEEGLTHKAAAARAGCSMGAISNRIGNSRGTPIHVARRPARSKTELSRDIDAAVGGYLTGEHRSTKVASRIAGANDSAVYWRLRQVFTNAELQQLARDRREGALEQRRQTEELLALESACPLDLYLSECDARLEGRSREEAERDMFRYLSGKTADHAISLSLGAVR